MSRLLYDDQNSKLLDVSLAGGRAKGFMFLLVGLVIFLVVIGLWVMFFFSIKSMITDGSVLKDLGNILLLLLLQFVLILMGTLFTAGGLYGASIRNLKVYNDRIKLPYFWKTIRKDSMITVVSTPEQGRKQLDTILKIKRKNNPFFIGKIREMFIEDMMKKLEKGYAIYIPYHDRFGLDDIGVIDYSVQRDMEAILRSIQRVYHDAPEEVVALEMGRIAQREKERIKIHPVLHEELIHRIKFRYIPIFIAPTLLFLLAFIVLLIIGELPLALLSLMFVLILAFVDMIPFFMISSPGKTCEYIIDNNGTLEDLKASSDVVTDEIMVLD